MTSSFELRGSFENAVTQPAREDAPARPRQLPVQVSSSHSARSLRRRSQCDPSAGAIQEAAKSTIPAITIPYAVSRIVLAIFGVVILLVMK